MRLLAILLVSFTVAAFFNLAFSAFAADEILTEKSTAIEKSTP
jgi:hypothetical protein